MRSGLAQSEEHAAIRPSRDAGVPPVVALGNREIPYDYVAQFILEGIRGKRKQDVINISVEGAFVATSIGYSFIPKPLADQKGQIRSLGTSVLSSSSTLQFPATLVEVIADVITKSMIGAATADPNDTRVSLANSFVCLLKRFCGIEFQYSIVDSGTGRELQNQPIHNIAGLGSAEGRRPFRPFPKPMTFLPRSTIRIEVEEISEGSLYAGAELQIVFHGYKVLGYGT